MECFKQTSTSWYYDKHHNY